MDKIDNKYTMVIKKGTMVTLYVNDDRIKRKQSSVLSVKKKKSCIYSVKALKTGKAAITFDNKKIKFKVVK